MANSAILLPQSMQIKKLYFNLFFFDPLSIKRGRERDKERERERDKRNGREWGESGNGYNVKLYLAKFESNVNLIASRFTFE